MQIARAILTIKRGRKERGQLHTSYIRTAQANTVTQIQLFLIYETLSAVKGKANTDKRARR
jgi:hypothetical protein